MNRRRTLPKQLSETVVPYYKNAMKEHRTSRPGAPGANIRVLK